MDASPIASTVDSHNAVINALSFELDGCINNLQRVQMRMRRRAELDKICLVAVVTDKGSDVFRIWSAVDVMA